MSFTPDLELGLWNAWIFVLLSLLIGFCILESNWEKSNEEV